MRNWFLILGVVGLTACTASREIVQTTSTPASVSFEYADEHYSKQVVADKAQAHCRQYGKDARITGSQVGRTMQYTEVFFACI